MVTPIHTMETQALHIVLSYYAGSNTGWDTKEMKTALV